MFYLFRRAAVSLVVLGVIGAYSSIDRSMNWKPAKASISYIDRTCGITETVYNGDNEVQSANSYRGACNSVDEWDKVRSKRSKTVDGVAVVHLSYTAPQNGQSESAELRFDGRDDEFYRLRAGDEMDILVSNSDPTKIRKG